MLKYLKQLRQTMIQNKQLEIEEQRKNVIEEITREWTPAQIDNYNNSLIINSAGWIGGDYNEKDIKIAILDSNKQYFSEEEILEYEKMILGKQKVKENK